MEINKATFMHHAKMPAGHLVCQGSLTSVVISTKLYVAILFMVFKGGSRGDGQSPTEKLNWCQSVKFIGTVQLDNFSVFLCEESLKPGSRDKSFKGPLKSLLYHNTKITLPYLRNRWSKFIISINKYPDSHDERFFSFSCIVCVCE